MSGVQSRAARSVRESYAPPADPAVSLSARSLLAWGFLAAALLVMYVPTIRDVYTAFWSQERGTSGPLVLACVAWLFWRERDALLVQDQPPELRVGSAIFALGLALYVIGRSQEFYQPEVLSIIPVLAGALLITHGRRTVRRLWFPLMFLIFAVPLPGSLLDAILVPLKQLVSVSAEAILHAVGYPVGRTGVVLTIGQYQLLIADACSGLASMIALSGVGVLYVYLAGHSSLLHNALLLLSELPIAFASNVIRVIILMLGTYHFGETVGHHLHEVMQLVQMVLAFGMFFLWDAVLSRVLGAKAAARGRP